MDGHAVRHMDCLLGSKLQLDTKTNALGPFLSGQFVELVLFLSLEPGLCRGLSLVVVVSIRYIKRSYLVVFAFTIFAPRVFLAYFNLISFCHTNPLLLGRTPN
jgi:hypothetical protein